MVKSPRLIIRALEVRVVTSDGKVGRRVDFKSGLNVIRANNTSGKSTTLLAIVYALGLEGMFNARHDVPFAHAMTHQVSVSGVEQPVLESCVCLEVENGDGEIVTLTRQVKNPKVKTSLINVTFGPVLTGTGNYQSKDYFVRRPGAAQREAGFHNFLPDFLGWKLPLVPGLDGREMPLYVETLFPYFYVEQKHGWSGIHARIPNYLGIRDVSKRSAEFVLGLEVFDRILRKQRISNNISFLENQWRNTLQELQRIAKTANASLQNPPKKILDSRDPESAFPVVFANNAWTPIDNAIQVLSFNINERKKRPVPSVKSVAHTLEYDLQKEESSIITLLIEINLVVEERNQLRNRRDQLKERVKYLEEDLQRHKDALTLIELGSQHTSSFLHDQICPTCHQGVHDGMEISAYGMTAKENIDFINRQLNTFRLSLNDVLRSSEAVEIRENSLRETLIGQRRRVRALRETLLGTNSAPSLAEVRERVVLQDQLDLLQDRQGELISLRSDLGNIAIDYEQQKQILAQLSSEKLSDQDLTKIVSLEEDLRTQLVRYQFSSLPTRQVDIDRETYQPTHEGFELGFDLSASDMIRVIWAYLQAIMKVSGEKGGNHLGLLIFDEPRQQETAPESYRELLQKTAEHNSSSSQIIIATSENKLSLLEMLKNATFNLIDIPPDQKLLMPLE